MVEATLEFRSQQFKSDSEKLVRIKQIVCHPRTLITTFTMIVIEAKSRTKASPTSERRTVSTGRSIQRMLLMLFPPRMRASLSRDAGHGERKADS